MIVASIYGNYTQKSSLRPNIHTQKNSGLGFAYGFIPTFLGFWVWVWNQYPKTKPEFFGVWMYV